jgi:hypothetical protein
VNCDKETINNARIVCKQWNSLINQDSFWKQYYQWNYSSNKNLNLLVNSLPNHTYSNICKYKLESKHQLITNVEDENKKSFTLFNLNEYNLNFTGVSPLLIKHEACIKHDCMVWLKKQDNTIKYLEYKNPNNITTFVVGRAPVRKVSLVENLIVCIADSHTNLGFTIHIFSIDERYKDLHLSLTFKAQTENERLRYVDGYISDNLIIVVTSEMTNKPPIFVAGRGWVNPLEEDYTTMVWDLTKLIEALKKNEHNESLLYDKIYHIKLPGVFSTGYIYSCPFQKMNETTNKYEKFYYIMCNGDSGKTTKIDILDENLRIEDTKIFQKESIDARDALNVPFICPDGTIVISCDRTLLITSVNNFDHQIKIPFNRRYTILNIMHTPDILYVLYRYYALARELITLAVIDIKDIKSATEEIPIKHFKLFEYDFGTLVYNKFLDTGLIHYSSKTNQIIFCPFSKVFCN